MTRIRALVSVVAMTLLGLLITGSTAAQDASPAASAAPAISAVLLGGGEPVGAPGYALTLRRITLPPGTGIPAHTHPGALVIYLESGTWGYTPLSGTERLTRAAAEGGSPAPTEDLAMGTEVILNAGDVLYVDEPADAVRNAGNENVVLLVAGLTRVGEKFTTLVASPSPSPTS